MRNLYLIILSAILLGVSSCTQGNDTNYELPADALVYGFKLSKAFNAYTSPTSHRDTIAEYSGVDKTFFTIDWVGEKIFNADSLPVGTKTNKIFAEITFSSVKKVTLYTSKDTMEYKSLTDTIDFSSPVKMEVLAADGVTKKTFEIKINVHTQNPDSLNWKLFTNAALPESNFTQQKTIVFGSKYVSFVKTTSGIKAYTSAMNDKKSWSAIACDLPLQADLYSLVLFNNKPYVVVDGNVYTSSNGSEWMQTAGLNNVVNLIGVKKAGSKDDKLIAIIKENDVYKFAYTSLENQWEIIGGIVPEDFPLSGYSQPVYFTNGNIQTITIAGGRTKNGHVTSAVWSYDGINTWANLSMGAFVAREGAMLFEYETNSKLPGKELMLIGGSNFFRTVLKDVYVSEDKGMSWTLYKKLYNLPAEFEPRAFASVYVDTTNHELINIFGGKSISESLNDIWIGRINKLAFKPIQ